MQGGMHTWVWTHYGWNLTDHNLEEQRHTSDHQKWELQHGIHEQWHLSSHYIACQHEILKNSTETGVYIINTASKRAKLGDPGAGGLLQRCFRSRDATTLLQCKSAPEHVNEQANRKTYMLEPLSDTTGASLHFLNGLELGGLL